MTKGLGAHRGVREDIPWGPDSSVFWPSVWRTAWETRWISLYVSSMLFGMAIFLTILHSLEILSLRTGLLLLCPPFCGYLSAVWLQAAKNCASGKSALGAGCFQATRRQLAWATVAFCGSCLGAVAGWHAPLRVAYASLVMLTLPRLILGGQSLRFAIGSSLRALRRRPQLVVAALTTALALCGASEWVANWGQGMITNTVVYAECYTSNWFVTQLIRSPVSLMLAHMLLAALRMAGWMVAATISFCLYWQFGPATNRWT